MTLLYTKNGEYPKQIPHMIRLSNGSVRSDRTTFTAEEIADAGYVQVDEPPVYTYPNKLEWNGTGWVVREPNEVEISQRWSEIRADCITRLSATDYKVIKSVESGSALDPLMIAYRQALRDIYNNINNLDPWNIDWPTQPQSGE